MFTGALVKKMLETKKELEGTNKTKPDTSVGHSNFAHHCEIDSYSDRHMRSLVTKPYYGLILPYFRNMLVLTSNN